MLESYENCKDIINSGKNRKTAVELITGTQCQNACNYCYRVTYQNTQDIEPVSIDRMKMYLDNAIEMGLIDNQTTIEFFGGDPILDYNSFCNLLETFEPYAKEFVVPTNGRILENIKEEEVKKMFELSKNKLHLSLSVDTPYQEKNRPLSKFGKMQHLPEERNWKHLIDLSHKFDIGWHPMLSFDTVTEWFNTWKYCLDNDIYVYLLEIRHALKTPDLSPLIEGVYQLAKIVNYCNKNNIKNTFNITAPGKTYRGLGCSALTALTINIDGKVYMCHRLLDRKKYLIADLVTKQIDITNFILLSSGFDFKNNPYCMDCPICDICPGQCIGTIDEYWDLRGNISTPLRSLCHYFYLKIGLLRRIDNDWAKSISNEEAIRLDNLVFSIFGSDVYNNIIKRLNEEEEEEEGGIL